MVANIALCRVPSRAGALITQQDIMYNRLASHSSAGVNIVGGHSRCSLDTMQLLFVTSLRVFPKAKKALRDVRETWQ